MRRLRSLCIQKNVKMRLRRHVRPFRQLRYVEQLAGDPALVAAFPGEWLDIWPRGEAAIESAKSGRTVELE